MTTNFLALERAAAIEPGEIRRTVERLEAKARECEDLAGSCLTEEARDALIGMADDFRQEADELELALGRLTRLCAQASDGQAAH